MKSILDPSFRYVNSQSTDLHKTFARIRRQMTVGRALTDAKPSFPARVVSIAGARRAQRIGALGEPGG